MSMFLAPPETGECAECIVCHEYMLEILGDYDSDGNNFTCFGCTPQQHTQATGLRPEQSGDPSVQGADLINQDGSLTSNGVIYASH